MKNKKIASKTCIQPISCIAYPHNETILIDCLKRLQSKMPSVEYCYIFHHGENGDKDHYHLLLRNTSNEGFRNVLSLFNYFMQPCNQDIFDSNNILKYSKGEMVCFIAQRQFIVTNSLGDWYDYVLHNEEYLKNKV